MSAKDFAQPDNFFRMGTPPVMVDIMPKIGGVEFEEAWRRRLLRRIGILDVIDLAIDEVEHVESGAVRVY